MLDPELWGTVITALTSTQTFTVTPDDAAELEFEDVCQYTVSSLDTDEDYRIELFEAANVDMDANGVGASGQSADDVSPQPGGEITFTVEAGADYETFVPVVFVEGGDSDAILAIDDDGLPTEDFGIGGQITVIPMEAETGAVPDDVEIEAP